MTIQKNLKNRSGFLTIEFAMALLMSVGLSVIFFVLAFSLSSAFVAQYIGYSVGHIYAGGNINVQEQEKLASQKFRKIMATPGIGKLFSQGWFTLVLDSNAFRSGQNGQIFEEYGGSRDGQRLAATGVRLVYTTKLFNLNLGPLGSTNPDDEAFSAKITGFMIRNPTQKECEDYMKVETRHQALIQIDSRFSQYDSTPGSNQKYFPMEDNGC
ncbi:MAG: hypothetical protein JNL11_14405 [Bdellovibrionaceae bacterium]|nr:hypothetical protein [Pseudobdellovibrionaceae bacterium]